MENYKQRVEEAAAWLAERAPRSPRVGIVLGSGLGGLVAEIEDPVRIDYREIPGFLTSTAPGHSGALRFGHICDTPVVAMEGRFHVYEGYPIHEITLPVRVMARLGIRDVVVTNACGGLNLALNKGDLLIIDDHINLLGVNPLTAGGKLRHKVAAT